MEMDPCMFFVLLLPSFWCLVNKIGKCWGKWKGMINGRGARVGYIKFSTVDSTSPLWPNNYKWPAAKDANGQVTDWNNGTYQERDQKVSDRVHDTRLQIP